MIAKSNRAPKLPKVRYAVVGLGYISQAAVLPAFAHAKKNSALTALVSDDPTKLKKLGKKYGVASTWSYDQYDECLRSGDIDAVYIALPNDMHRDYAVRAAQAGVHVLCEKPLAVTEEECREMIDAAADNGVKLMTAYRLHFEAGNMRAVEIAQSGKIGEPRVFASTFTMQVEDPDNIRLQARSGGPLYDIGIYCINAARYLFRAEPIQVTAFAATGEDARFAAVDEMVSAILRFPDERLATFTCSFGAADVSEYRIVGTKGDVCVEPAYEFAEGIEQYVTVNGRTTKKSFPKRDQFAPELIHFSDCIASDVEPEPSGVEGLADVRVIRALVRSAERGGQPVDLEEFVREQRPVESQTMRKPPVSKPKLVHARSPSSG